MPRGWNLSIVPVRNLKLRVNKSYKFFFSLLNQYKVLLHCNTRSRTGRFGPELVIRFFRWMIFYYPKTKTMKKIVLAAFLIVASGPAFTQTNQAYNQNINGQNDCQCAGVGISPHGGAQFKSVQTNGSAPTVSSNGDMVIPGMWLKMIQHYFDQLRDPIVIKRGGK